MRDTFDVYDAEAWELIDEYYDEVVEPHDELQLEDELTLYVEREQLEQ